MHHQCVYPETQTYNLSVSIKLLTLHVHNQQRVADGQRRPEPEGLRGREEVFIDDWYGCQHGHKERDDHNPAEQRQQAVAWCEEADANAAVALWAVELK